MSLRSALPAAALLIILLATASLPASALFEQPAPEIIYTGTAPGTDAGIFVIRDAEAWKDALERLDPAYGGDEPDLDDMTLLLVVGRERLDACRETRLVEVSTERRMAYARMEEVFPSKECACADVVQPPRAWVVSVSRFVRRGEIRATDIVRPCEGDTAPTPQLEGPTPIGEGLWDVEPGARIYTNANAWNEACADMELEEVCPAVDFSTQHAVAVIGRSRENGCRRTLLVQAERTSDEEVGFMIDEIYPEQGQMCTQIFRAPKVFLFAVPRSVERARVSTRTRP